MRRVKVLAVLSFLAALVLLSSCASGGSEAAPEGAKASDELEAVPEDEWEDQTGKAEVTIVAKDNSFTPEYVTVSPDTKVVFDNRGRTAHNALPVDDGAFDKVTAEELQPGDTAEVVLGDAGDYPYYCSLHGTKTAGMIGRVRVADQ
jgi:plastocyanin